jgi:hypothetical protein
LPERVPCGARRRCTTTLYNKRLPARLRAGAATPVGEQLEEDAELAIEIVALL